MTLSGAINKATAIVEVAVKALSRPGPVPRGDLHRSLLGDSTPLESGMAGVVWKAGAFVFGQAPPLLILTPTSTLGHTTPRPLLPASDLRRNRAS